MNSGSFTALLLAAGKGTRMQLERAKVMVPLAGKPLLLHVLKNLESAGCKRCILVVGHCHTEVEDFVRKESPIENIQFVFQKEQLGTGNALLCAEESLSKHRGPFIVCAGDMPLLSSRSFRNLFRHHTENANTLSVLSAKMEDPYGYGRICKDVNGQLERIVEEKDASTEERKIQEVNTGSYVLESPKIFPLLREIGCKNAQGEYYLPDLVAISRKKGHAVSSLCLRDPLEAKGVNTLSELEALEKLLFSKKKALSVSTRALQEVEILPRTSNSY